jgi:lysophospholipase L1-like esterase
MERNICILGDSITWGVSDNEKGGWVSRLWLDSENNKNKEVDIYIYNLGIPGDITTYLLDRMVIECNARAADTIIVAIGINDTAFVNSDKPRTEIDWFRWPIL